MSDLRTFMISSHCQQCIRPCIGDASPDCDYNLRQIYMQVVEKRGARSKIRSGAKY